MICKYFARIHAWNIQMICNWYNKSYNKWFVNDLCTDKAKPTK